METNHNAWTLIKHLSHSANVVAGRVDQAIYDPKPVNYVSFWEATAGFIVFIILLCYYFSKFDNRNK